jgi:hypothetical protein
VGQLDQDENAKQDKKRKADEMELLKLPFEFFETMVPCIRLRAVTTRLHPKMDIKEKADDSDDAARDTSRYI